MEKLFAVLRSGVQRRLEGRGLKTSSSWPEFLSRLDGEFVRLAELLWSLYGGRPDFAFQLEELLAEAFAAYEGRSRVLRARDVQKTPESGWFGSHTQVGAVAYTDLFAGTFLGLEKKIPYLKELGVTYLHLMPFSLCPKDENDGGYAVSSYRETNPALGSIEDLELLAQVLEKEGIALVADFVFNHTSNEHAWAHKAQTGDSEFQDYYWIFSDRAETEVYQAQLRDIFPEMRKGSFSFHEGLQKWVWTTFNSYQWDLNYSNPAVFRAMAAEMLFLANRGVSILRLDAVAFIWKQAGTVCENLPEAHTLIRAFQSLARLVCPSLLFKSEAIVHPDDIEKYIDLRECAISYNPLLMADLWEASATKEVKLLAHSLRKRHHLPDGCLWVNYVRSHDDIGWTFADEDAREVGIQGYDHRQFLNRFFTGDFPGSFSRGLRFQYNPVTRDMRISGTAASLAGIEAARREGLVPEMDTAVRRVLLLYGVVFSVGGLPLVYLGDELGRENDYSFERDPGKAYDSRWVHRPAWDDALAQSRADTATVAGRVFQGLSRLSRERREHPVFGTSDLTVLESGHPSVLAYSKRDEANLLVVFGNFSETRASVTSEVTASVLAGRNGVDLLSSRQIFSGSSLDLEPCELLWVLC